MIKMSLRGIERLRIHEGYRDHMYKCPAGFNTLGYGHNCDANPLTNEQQDFWDEDKRKCAALLLDEDVSIFEHQLFIAKPFVQDMDKARIDVLIGLTFNMGVGWISKWPKCWKALKEERYKDAANEIRNSKYAKQVGARAKEYANQIETGKYL